MIKGEEMSCPLCRVADWVYQDDVCWIAYCKSHPDKLIVVLKRHSRFPSPREMEHIIGLVKRLYPHKRWKFSNDLSKPAKIRDHFHMHEE